MSRIILYGGYVDIRVHDTIAAMALSEDVPAGMGVLAVP